MFDDIDDVVGAINWDDDPFSQNILEDGLLSSHDPSSQCFYEIEQILMNDDDVGPVSSDPQAAAEFLSDLLVDSPPQSAGEVTDSKVSSGSEVDDDEKVNDKVDPKNASDELNNDDPMDKKRKRQMRNRDAAVRSRERKKSYVRDLELKSKYFESECKRLGWVLQCCLAENQALRFSLQNGSANGACTTKQESAVLLLESLLLGSLLWFLGIMCLLILPSQARPIPEENLQSKNPGLLVPNMEPNKTRTSQLFLSFMMGKRCKASRFRMKFNPQCLGMAM